MERVKGKMDVIDGSASLVGGHLRIAVESNVEELLWGNNIPS